MKLNVQERLMLPGILPQKGNLHTITMGEDIKKKVTLSADEIKKSGLDTQEKSYIWTDNIEAEIKFTSDELKMLKDQANQLSTDGEITPQTLSLIEKLLK